MKHTKTLLFETQYTNPAPCSLRELLKIAAGLSNRSLRQFFFKGQILVNQRKAHSEAKIKQGDWVRVYTLEENTDTLVAEALPVEVVYEDEQLLVLNKPAALPVHPSGNITSGTLANRVAWYYRQHNLKIKVRPVNRLDQGTSGLIIFAKSAAAQEKTSLALQQHQISRIYYAVVQGVPSPREGIIDQPIAQIRGQRQVLASGKPAQTHYRVVESFPQAALVELALKTGRTHQIRIHLQHLGVPIIGDSRYGTHSTQINRPALHAGKLQFTGPGFNLPELTVPLPEDMRHLIEDLRCDEKNEATPAFKIRVE